MKKIPVFTAVAFALALSLGATAPAHAKKPKVKKLKVTGPVRKNLACLRDLGKQVRSAVENNDPAETRLRTQLERLTWVLAEKIETSGVAAITRHEVAHCRETLAKVTVDAPVPAFDLPSHLQSPDATVQARAKRVEQMATNLSYTGIRGKCGVLSGDVSIGLGLELGLGAHAGGCRMDHYGRFAVVGLQGIAGLGVGVAALVSVAEIDYFDESDLTGKTSWDDHWKGIVLAYTKQVEKNSKRTTAIGGGIGIGEGIREHGGVDAKILPLGIAYRRMLNDLVGITSFQND
ncbi:MAG: hypothetical protein JNL01_16105 [Bdellovibrionales bacterium]|nr:hypothetical protein [Bdellovibrionales bacterium]